MQFFLLDSSQFHSADCLVASVLKFWVFFFGKNIAQPLNAPSLPFPQERRRLRFVIYHDHPSCQRAIAALHSNFTFPGGGERPRGSAACWLPSLPFISLVFDQTLASNSSLTSIIGIMKVRQRRRTLHQHDISPVYHIIPFSLPVLGLTKPTSQQWLPGPGFPPPSAATWLCGYHPRQDMACKK